VLVKVINTVLPSRRTRLRMVYSLDDVTPWKSKAAASVLAELQESTGRLRGFPRAELGDRGDPSRPKVGLHSR